MITLLEGPDGSGKSTLSVQLSSKLNAQQFHYGPVTGDIFKHYLTFLANLQHPLVLDRMWPSEHIYGPCYRRVDRLGAKSRMLERLLLSFQGVIVWCDPGVEKCLKAFTSGREEMLETTVQFLQVYQAYRQFYRAYRFPHVIYDWTSGVKLDEFCANIEAQRPPKNAGPGLGCFRPGNILLLGDVSNSLLEWPFVSDTGCSPWLCEQLAQTNVPEEQLYWVNVNSYKAAISPAFLEQFQPRQVIALGKSAQQWCVKNSIKHDAVPHPQSWKRFHSHERYPLLEVLHD